MLYTGDGLFLGMRNDKPNLIVDISFKLALQVVDFSELLKRKKMHDLASQIFRCGTSVGANIYEAQNAESKADFIHKFKIAAKEADELGFWMNLCQRSERCPTPDSELLESQKKAMLIISKIISSSKQK
jgi:four helix bundle protein